MGSGLPNTPLLQHSKTPIVAGNTDASSQKDQSTSGAAFSRP
jgi:hypothetical protein